MAITYRKRLNLVLWEHPYATRWRCLMRWTRSASNGAPTVPGTHLHHRADFYRDQLSLREP